MSKKASFFFCALLAAAACGCETIHTGILGDIPTGMKPSGVLKAGHIYKDPQGRFSAAITDNRNLVAKKSNEGVVFEGKYLDRGDLIYAVLVYPVPPTLTGNDEQTLRTVWQGLVAQADTRKFSFNQIDEQVSTFQGRPSLDIYYTAQAGNYWRPYISRFVRVGESVYNLYYSDGNFYLTGGSKKRFESKEGFDTILKENAEKFFNGVRFVIE